MQAKWLTQTEGYTNIEKTPSDPSDRLYTRTTTIQMPTAKPTAPPRRSRKRKRRQAWSSSSSDSSDSSSDESEVPEKTPVNKVPLKKPQATVSSPSPSPSSSSSSLSDSEGSDDDDDDDAPVAHPVPSSAIPQRTDSEPAKTRDRYRLP